MKKVSKQPYRLWYEYLKTALKYNMPVNRNYYKRWHLNTIKNAKLGQGFDKWFSSHQSLFEEYDSSIKLVDTIKRDPDSIILQIPKNYSVKRLQKEIGAVVGTHLNQSNAEFKIKSKRTLMIAPMDYMLWCWQLKQQDKFNVHGGLGMIWEELNIKVSRRSAKAKGKVKRRAVMGGEDGASKAITVSKNIRKAERILKNVCRGDFPGNYSIS